MEPFEWARLDAYFGRICARLEPGTRPTCFMVTHLLPERPAFVQAVSSVTRLRALLPIEKATAR